MPRRDGLDTNQEMLVDFNTKSREAFVAAYEKQFDGSPPDAYIGKPLNALSLHVVKRLVRTDIEEDAIRRQELKVRTLHEGDVDFMKEHLTMRQRPQDVHDHYAAVAATIGTTVIDHALDLRKTVPVEGVVADYAADLAARTRHVGTLKEKPTKFSLALGKTFADEVIEYIDSEGFMIAKDAPEVAAVISDTTHHFSLEMRPDIPLNGRESTAWLNEYANKMLGQVQSLGARLQRLEDIGAPEVILAHVRASYDQAVAALKRVEKIIEEK